MTQDTNNQVTEPMGRPPIHDTPMSPAERQRRRRHRLRNEPWNDPRSLAWAVVAAVRGLRGDPTPAISDDALAAIIERATGDLTANVDGDEAAAEAADAAVAALTGFLDPDQPLPERRKHGRHGGRGHKFGERHRRRREGRRAADD
ncbi:MAG: hypothetical protein HOL07_03280 [Rhodospirillaceae bacterium]|jgi:hypothetical protein|nr:hypothetical protein [Rhodospirillaceae bacterium]MBT3809596.1 hypothetical protein [Rhodospirillaceae bacterium]MBT3932506.1 hypothetical protein [Rhodospirillaceae bacterium]MBT4771612.1 hypothetical protein [Rhodospirillaceae bacterium]MBT5357345.1 hypothetical protein [Rhodospirillaceae bacterium]